MSPSQHLGVFVIVSVVLSVFYIAFHKRSSCRYNNPFMVRLVRLRDEINRMIVVATPPTDSVSLVQGRMHAILAAGKAERSKRIAHLRTTRDWGWGGYLLPPRRRAAI